MGPIDDAIAQLLHGDRRAREHAAFVLRRRTFDVTRLAPLLAHPHVSRQVKAIEIMRAVRAPAAIPLLVPMLGSSDWPVPDKAASALQRIGAAAADMIAASLPGSTEQHRFSILDALSRLQDPRGRDPLIEISTRHAQPGWRRSALDSLRRYRDAPTVEAIRAALRDLDRDVRKDACKVAGIVRDPSLLAPLMAIWLEETWPPVHALFAIGKYSTAAMDPLIASVAGTEPVRQTRITDALLHCMNSQQGRAQLWMLWRRPEPAVRDACLQLLGEGYARSLPAQLCCDALAEHVADPDPQRRRWCVAGYRQLAHTSRSLAVDGLHRLAADPDATVRSRAEALLRELALGHLW